MKNYLIISFLILSSSLMAKSSNAPLELPSLDQIKNTLLFYKNHKVSDVKNVISNNQQNQENLKSWHLNYDPSTHQGINFFQAQEKYLKQLNLKEVIVAVIDSGVDVNHPDLRERLWVNPEEAKNPNDGIDNDENGYIDDVYGWNFIGSPNGNANFSLSNDHLLLKSNPDKNLQMAHARNVETRVYVSLKKKEAAGEVLSDAEKTQMSDLLQQINMSVAYKKNMLKQAEDLESTMKPHVDIIRQDGYTGEFDYEGTFNLTNYQVQDLRNKEKIENAIRELLLILYSYNIHYTYLKNAKKEIQTEINFHYNMDLNWNPRTIIGEPDFRNSYYGNNDVKGFMSEQGTHIAGIIAARVSADESSQGIASNVKIMSLKVVPSGDEHDQDVANAIYYAVNNGAKIINLSFSKNLSPHVRFVQEAISHAQNKNVQIIHSAGNAGKEINLKNNFPNKDAGKKKNKKILFTNFFEVGASTPSNDNRLGSKYTNYSASLVDVFAPGVSIYSLAPEASYATKDGTSVSAPIISAIFALSLGKDSTLSSNDFQALLKESVRRYGLKRIYRPGQSRKTPPLVYFNSLSATGGIIDMEKVFYQLNNPFGL